ncbi:MAG: hypothetical protein PHD31_02735 [Candidatus Pacebacteria bacterium]|nr:hypothetical protein [Candidatus Paceibacterota bacterium]
MKITKKTKLAKILDNSKVKKILEKHEFPCVSCPYARYEMEELEIGVVCDKYDIDASKLIKELNSKLNK